MCHVLIMVKGTVHMSVPALGLRVTVCECVWVRASMCMEINAECVHSFQIPICNICYSYLALFVYAVGFAPYNWMKQCYSISFNRIIMHRKFTIQLFNNVCSTIAHFIFTHWIRFIHLLFFHTYYEEKLFHILHVSLRLDFKFSIEKAYWFINK